MGWVFGAENAEIHVYWAVSTGVGDAEKQRPYAWSRSATSCGVRTGTADGLVCLPGCPLPPSAPCVRVQDEAMQSVLAKGTLGVTLGPPAWAARLFSLGRSGSTDPASPKAGAGSDPQTRELV